MPKGKGRYQMPTNGRMVYGGVSIPKLLKHFPNVKKGWTEGWKDTTVGRVLVLPTVNQGSIPSAHMVSLSTEPGSDPWTWAGYHPKINQQQQQKTLSYV